MNLFCKNNIPKLFSAIKKHFPKYIIFLIGSLLYREKKAVLVQKSWGLLKNFKIRSGFIFRPRPINICKSTELKSRWTVPLSM
jgi:hypothetical protein